MTAVALVIVSHSALIAEGVRELCAQAAPDVKIHTAGGTSDGRLGSSRKAVRRAVDQALASASALILTDLGSATFTAQSVLDDLDVERRKRCLLADAPLVEGALAAAATAQSGASLAEVAASAVAQRVGSESPTDEREDAAPASAARGACRLVRVPQGAVLHARPAARLVRFAATTDAYVTLDGRDASSLLAVLSLGIRGGDVVEVCSDRATGTAAVDQIAHFLERGFAD